MNVRIALAAAAAAALATALSGSLAAQLAPSTSDLVAHYSRVLLELRAADTSHLTISQRLERSRLIEVLDGYRQAADFGINRSYPNERKPYFVDDDGRRCAVAHLLDHSGMGKLTKEVQNTANHAWIVELSEELRLQSWLRRSGLTMEEAGRIQGPTRRVDRRRDPPEPPRPFNREEWVREFRPERGQEDAGPGQSSPAPRPGNPKPGNPKPATPGGIGRAPIPGTPNTPARGVPLSALPSQAWSTWWQWNRDEFIHPKARRAKVLPKPSQTSAKARSPRAERLLGALQKHAKDDSSTVRLAAAVAMGRLGDSRSIPSLLGMLDDANRDVRHAAILALGGTGSSRAVLELLHIAKTGHARGAGASISSLAQPLATIALGIARRYGSTVATAGMVHGPTFEVPKQRTRDMQLARLLYQALAPEEKVTAFARSLAEGKKTPLELRCRALEVLPFAKKDKAALTTLVRALNGSRLEARRSAALALGWFDHRLALGPLMTAFELEGELLTRAFLLLSIGRQGSKAGRDLLLTQVQRGRKSLRPWAAVGLGLAARKDAQLANNTVRDAILAARKAERNRDDSGAYLVALGLMRDRKSVPMMMEQLIWAKNSLARTAAAEALILVGPDVARPPLRKLLQDDQCYFARSSYASILGVIGDATDAPLLMKALKEESHPTTRGAIAVALGMLNDAAGFDALLPMLDDAKLSSRTRAQVLEGLGASLSQNAGMEIADLFQRANFLVFPGWLLDVGAVRL